MRQMWIRGVAARTTPARQRPLAVGTAGKAGSSDAGVQYSTGISDTPVLGLGDSDSDGFSTDVSDTRRKRPRVVRSGW